MPGDPAKRITISLPTDTYFMSGIRDFTLTMVRNMTGMNDQWAFRFQSVVDELCNNAIEHGSSQGKIITISFSSVAGEQIELVVEDTGTGPFPISAAELYEKVEVAKRAAADPLANMGLRGRGLSQIVSSWTSELRFEDVPGGGIRVIAVKLLSDHEKRLQPGAALGFMAASRT